MEILTVLVTIFFCAWSGAGLVLYCEDQFPEDYTWFGPGERNDKQKLYAMFLYGPLVWVLFGTASLAKGIFRYGMKKLANKAPKI